jgi:hypothetical protein
VKVYMRKFSILARKEKKKDYPRKFLPSNFDLI